MSLISSRLSLKHLVTVQRDAGGATNARGNPGAPNWQNNLVNVPCRAWTTSGVERADATSTVVIEDMRVIVALGTDVTEHDRLSDITERGTVIATGPIGIRAVMTHEDHLELVLVQLH